MRKPDNYCCKSSGAKIMRWFFLATAWMSGIFCLVVCVLVIIKYVNATAVNPLDQKSLQDLKQSSYKNQQDRELKEKMLHLESLARKAFFTNRAQIQADGFLLLGGIIIFVIAAKISAELRRRFPEPGKCSEQDDPIISGRIGRKAVIIFTVILIVVSLILAFLGPEICFTATSTENQERLFENTFSNRLHTGK